jgi:hypothetical protein
MRATLPRLIRVVTRSQLKAEYPGSTVVRALPKPVRSDGKQPTLIDSLLKRKQDMGAAYPPNIRIEPVLTKQTFEGLPVEAREELKELLKER